MYDENKKLKQEVSLNSEKIAQLESQLNEKLSKNSNLQERITKLSCELKDLSSMLKAKTNSLYDLKQAVYFRVKEWHKIMAPRPITAKFNVEVMVRNAYKNKN